MPGRPKSTRATSHGLVGGFPGPILIVASACWAVAGLIGRAAPLPGPDLAFWRALLGAGAYQAILAARGHRPRWSDIRAAALGGVGFGLSIACLFVAYKTTTLISANVIACLQPVILGVVAHRSGRRLDRWLWAATAVAVAGTVVVVLGSSERTGTWSLHGDLFALGGTLANVVYVIGTKRARAHMGSLDYQASQLWVAAVVVLPLALWSTGGHLVPRPVAWWSVLGLASIGGLGHLLFSSAQRHVSVAASSSIVLAEVLLVALGAAVVFHQRIGLLQAAGMVVVAAGIGMWLVRTAGELEVAGETDRDREVRELPAW